MAKRIVTISINNMMNKPATVIRYINIAHFIDHFSMLIFAAAVLVMAPVFNMGYGELLPYATPGFIAFGAGSLLSGWLGDRWSRRHMMVVFFIGMGFALIGVGLTQSPFQLGIGLFAIGIIASIYHPVGTAMLTAHAEQIGKELGINGVWGNLGVASSALITGTLVEFAGWRAAFIAPGILTIIVGLMFSMRVKHHPSPARKGGAQQARISRTAMALVIASLVITVLASSTTFNAVTVAIPKLFEERLSALTSSPATLGVIAATVYVFGAFAQYTIGHLIDKKPLKDIFLPLAIIIVPALYLASSFYGWLLIAVSIVVVIAIFGQVTVNDAMIAKYTSDEWRARAYSVRYFLGFTAAGLSVGLVSLLYQQGGFTTMLQAFSALCLMIVVGALIFPREKNFASVNAQ